MLSALTPAGALSSGLSSAQVKLGAYAQAPKPASPDSDDFITVTLRGKLADNLVARQEGPKGIMLSTLRFTPKDFERITARAYQKVRDFVTKDPTAVLPDQFRLRFLDDDGSRRDFFMRFNPNARKELDAFREQTISKLQQLAPKQSDLATRRTALQQSSDALNAERNRLEGASSRLNAVKNSLAKQGLWVNDAPVPNSTSARKLKEQLEADATARKELAASGNAYTAQVDAFKRDKDAFVAEVAAAKALPKAQRANSDAKASPAPDKAPTTTGLRRRFLKLLNPFGLSLPA